MGRAAQEAAAERQAALAARYATDLATLEWVRTALLGQVGGTMPASFGEHRTLHQADSP
jgi:hypothetical protein